MGTSSKAVLFFLSYFEALQELKPMQQLEAYNAIFQYAFYGTEPKPSKAVKPLWTLIKPTIGSSMKKRADGSKGGRGKETTGSEDDETSGLKNTGTAGSEDASSNKEKDKDKEIDKDKGKGIGAATASQRTKKKLQTAVFQSLPSSTNRIGYAATEELKRQQIPKIEKAAEQTAAQPPAQQEDAETAELKKAFRQGRAEEEQPAPAECSQPPPG